jgi:hypothetical protein
VITSINSNLSFENVGGPIVANNTNGNVEIVFENIAPNKPNSISEVNGFIDITLDAKVKADVKLNTINGEAYTDFIIDVKSSKPMAAMPAPMDMVNIQGSINGGGELITVSSAMGDMYPRKK